MRTRLPALLLVAGLLPAAPSLADESEERCIPEGLAEQLLLANETVAARYERARAFYDAEQLAEAAVLFRSIAFDHPSNELAPYATNLYLDSLNIMGSMGERPDPSCYDDLADAITAMVDESQPPGSVLLQDEELRRTVRTLRVGLLRKAAQALTEREGYAEASAIYLEIERDYPDVYDDRGRCEVLFNAAITLEAARKIESSNRIRKQLLTRYPSCELAAQTSLHLARSYHSLHLYREALAAYEDYAKKYPKAREATDALINAFELRLAFGELDEAAANFHRFERNYARREPAETATLSLHFGLRLLEAGRHREAREHLESHLKRYARVVQAEDRIRAEVALADTYWEQPRPNRKAAIAGYEKVVGRLERGAPKDLRDSSAASSAAAKARYRLALIEYERLVAIELPRFAPSKRVPPKIARWWKRKGREAEPDLIQFEYWSQHQFRDWLEQQGKALDATTRALREVAQLRSPRWTIAAAARSGDAYWRLAETLASIAPPPSMARDEQLARVFKDALGHRVEQPRQMALQAYEHCQQIALVATAPGDDGQHCRDQLTAIDPERFPPVDEQLPTVDGGEPAVLPFPGPLLERAEPLDP